MKKLKVTLLALVACVGVAIVCYGFSGDKKNFEMVKNLEIFFSVFREINAYYVDEINPKELIETAITEMLADLDPYTNFIPEDEMGDFKFMTTGEYGGVGSLISMSDTCYVVFREVYEGKPADKAGVRNGDYILSINGKDAKDMMVSEVSSNLKGEPNTYAVVRIKRPGEDGILEKKIKREKIQINPVSYYGMVDDEVGYIAMNNFTQDCAKAVETALVDLRDKQGAKKIILDLRDNPGGLLDEAIDLVNLFVPRGSEVVSTKSRITMYNKTYVAQKEPVDTEIPLVVMVSRRSASSSEIVAGALQDLDRAVIVGQRTFGKGLVQSTREIDYNTGLKLTTSKYYIPSGRCVQAIDYSHRDENGAVGYVPDSLISEFKTKGGRTVFDGGGVSPDVYVEIPYISNVTYAVAANNLPFLYSVDYRSKHSSIPSVEEFSLSDAEYDDFCKFVANRKQFTYKSEANELLKKMVKAAERDKCYEENKALFEQMEAATKPNLEKDMEINRKEIQELVEHEIVVDYYYQVGGAKYGIKVDPEVKAALETLHDDAKYDGLLDGTIESHAGDKRTANQ